MSQPQFKAYISKELMATFLDSLWKYCKERFTAKGFDEFESFMFIPFGDPGFDDDWEKSYILTFGKPYSDETLLTEEEAFTAMIEFCAKYVYSCGYDISEVLHLLFLIRYKPEEAKKERALWKENVEHFSKTRD